MDAGTASLTLLTGTSAWEKTECSDMDFKQTIVSIETRKTDRAFIRAYCSDLRGKTRELSEFRGLALARFFNISLLSLRRDVLIGTYTVRYRLDGLSKPGNLKSLFRKFWIGFDICLQFN